MFCFKCGEELKENAGFCSKCGNSVNSENNQNRQVKQVKKYSIWAWIFGVIFIIASIGGFSEFGFFSGLIYLVMGIVLLPYTRKMLETKLHFNLNKKFITAIIIICFVLSGIANSKSVKTENQVRESNNSVKGSFMEGFNEGFAESGGQEAVKKLDKQLDKLNQLNQ